MYISYVHLFIVPACIVTELKGCSDSYIFFGGILHVARRSKDVTATFFNPFTTERNVQFRKACFTQSTVGQVVAIYMCVYQPKQINQTLSLILLQGLTSVSRNCKMSCLLISEKSTAHLYRLWETLE